MNIPDTINKPKVAILMAVFGNAHFLSEQLSSILSQDYENFDIWISRDCDTETVDEVLKYYTTAFGRERFFVLDGPRKGAAENFLSLLFRPDIQADYFAYSDQDDVWDRDKLSRAIASLGPITKTGPTLYGSRSSLIDKNGNTLGATPLFVRPTGFRNALVQNVAAGHTMVMNGAARDILRETGVKNVPFHDWWTYLLVTGAGGCMVYDPHPSVQYRQHDGNLTGIPLKKISGSIRRIRRVFYSEFGADIRTNIDALQRSKKHLTLENLHTFEVYAKALEKPLLQKLCGLQKSQVYRQNKIENYCLYAAAVFGNL